MLELVNRLLYWVESNIGEDVSIEPINIQHKYASLLHMYEKVARSKGITLVNTVGEELVVNLVTSHLEVILRNLIDNAIKFTPSGGQIIVGCIEVARNTYRIFVSNTFSGMTDEKIDELLYTNNSINTRKVETKSPGLGIFLCKEHLHKLGSSLLIENGPMGVVTFSFNIESYIPNVDVIDSDS